MDLGNHTGVADVRRHIIAQDKLSKDIYLTSKNFWPSSGLQPETQQNNTIALQQGGAMAKSMLHFFNSGRNPRMRMTKTNLS